MQLRRTTRDRRPDIHFPQNVAAVLIESLEPAILSPQSFCARESHFITSFDRYYQRNRIDAPRIGR
jgi:hypothetical protein